ncbi:MAG: fructose-bisphosphate aldolase [Candidatus Thalassarchaeum betae]|uniref:fructose-bisphosphate aldolase n=1 Tax=Candidatus Thalassarchaeum betae TaxID=2599289 RepID=A0A2V3HSP4_9ARCH|nr:MAG: fructose-bisphosphate aldolase [Candidatus Thalassoarchaea betae]HIC50730.1 fructose-bisphosphate aldolase [Candidatus Poseidoniales archaeon]HIM13833.1 fructose-bisphosphate aldolase [Candidatus Poseidoniales archaeon]HIM92637.1 fructose-bisphosphate aldolase [Candidatus Poseidoniales archaeon]
MGGWATFQVMRHWRGCMADTLGDRLERILPGGRGVWIPMDHGVSGYPESGLERMDSVVDSAIEGGADAIVLHKGALSHQLGRTGWGSFVCHVSASTVHGGPRSKYKVSVASAEECWQRGAVGVSGQVNLGDEAEPEMISQLGNLTSEAFPLGVPVLGMVYPRGPNLKVADDDDTGGVAHAARIAWELGCNVVKVPWNGSADSFHRVTDAVPIPVLIAGGPRDTSFRELLDIVEAAMGAGGGGVCMGRQVFGAEDPTAHVRALRAIVHDGASAAEATELLGE